MAVVLALRGLSRRPTGSVREREKEGNGEKGRERERDARQGGARLNEIVTRSQPMSPNHQRVLHDFGFRGDRTIVPLLGPVAPSFVTPADVQSRPLLFRRAANKSSLTPT